MSNKAQKLLKTKDVLNKYDLELCSNVPRKASVELERIPPRHIIKVTKETWNPLDDYAICKSAKLQPDQHEQFKQKIFGYKTPVKHKDLDNKVADKLTASAKLKARSKYVGPVHRIPVRIVPKLHVIEEEIQVHDDDFSISDNSSSMGSFEKLVREINSMETGIENQLDVFQKLVKEPIVNRTAVDVCNLFDFVRPLPAFSKMNDELLRQVCTVARIDYFQNSDIVCQPEGLTNMWMVVLVGKCQIRKLIETQTAKHSNYPPYFINQSTLVQLSTAESIIDLDEYSRIYRHVRQKTREHNLKLFEDIDFCSKMKIEDKITMSDFMTNKVFKKDDVVQLYGQHVDKIGLVIKGKCLAFVTLPDGTMVKLGIFELEDYFNEQLCFMQTTNPQSSSYFNIKALEDLEIGFFGAAELQSIIGNPIELSEISSMSQDQSEILDIQKLELQAKEWKVLRKRQILGLIKEWEGNPEALGKKWREQHQAVKPTKNTPVKKEISAEKDKPVVQILERPRSCLKRNTGSAGKRVVITLPDNKTP
ncbi:hypothetical protein HDV01_004788 [Terramyces sp. JEL0728]|nr:hypothetical protein HDV01_004788 [Terramyces sp. JEL0728]